MGQPVEVGVGVWRRPTRQGRLQKAPGDQIREAPVGSGGVGVVPRGEPEVPVRRLPRVLDDVLTLAEQLHDGERQVREPGRVLPASLGEEFLERAGARLGRELAPLPRGQLDEPPPALGRVEHPPQRREAFALQVLRGDPVGRDHEVLDQLLRPILLVRPQVGEQVAVEHGPGLERLEAQGPALVPQGPHGLSRPILDPELLVETRDRGQPRRRGSRPVEPGGDPVVGELRLVPHDRAVHVGGDDRPSRVDHHLDDERQARLILSERREIGREPLREHREDLGRGVDRRGVGSRMVVDGGARRHERVDVGHRDEDLDRSVAHRRRDGELIEIPGVVVVDRAPEEVAKIADRGAGVGRRLRDGLGLLERGGREVREEPALAHRSVRDVSQAVAIRLGDRTHGAHSI